MKNSKEYSQRVKKLYRSLKRKYPRPSKAAYDEPTEALIYGLISEKTSQKLAQSAIKRFAGHFIDWNSLRVSLTEEIIETLDEDTADARETASKLTSALNWIFRKYNTVSLEALKKMGKRPAKETLEKIEGVSHFVASYCMLTSLQGHAIPLTAKMVEYLRDNELVHPEADEHEIEGFLERQVSAKDGYEFYYLLRHISETTRARKKKKEDEKQLKKKPKKPVKSAKTKAKKSKK